MDAVDHVVLGAGAVGMAVVEALVRRGESVRVVNRSGLHELPAGVQSLAGDITDPALAASATRGARVVYQALNPPYHRWVTEPSFLALQGIRELLDTYDLVHMHYNRGLQLAGVIVNRWERTLEHRRGVAEIERYFGPGLAWRPYLPKRTVLQDAARGAVPIQRLGTPAGREVTDALGSLTARLARPHAIR